MPEERPDFHTRFKKGQSGNPQGRPKGRKNQSTLIADALFRTIRIKEGDKTRSIPKIAAAAEVCLNKALKGDVRAFIKMMEIAEKFKLFQHTQPAPYPIVIRRIIVDPREQPSASSPELPQSIPEA